MLISLKFPMWGLRVSVLCCAVLLYLRPEPPGARANTAARIEEEEEVLPQDEDFTIAS
jgi:hypothetical protein